MTEQRDIRLVKLATLWERTSAKGRRYFSGFLGDCQLVMFGAGEITRPSGEVVQTWKLLIQERERPQRRDLPTRGQQTYQAVRQRADEHAPRVFGTKADRDARVQELAEAFDRRGPDEESGF